MGDNSVIELKRQSESGGLAFYVRGCDVTITPPVDKSLTVNEIAEVFDEAKKMAIKMHSISLAGIELPPETSI